MVKAELMLPRCVTHPIVAAAVAAAAVRAAAAAATVPAAAASVPAAACCCRESEVDAQLRALQTSELPSKLLPEQLQALLQSAY
jgi:guanyl-specific ribonuclease Sa